MCSDVCQGAFLRWKYMRTWFCISKSNKKFQNSLKVSSGKWGHLPTFFHVHNTGKNMLSVYHVLIATWSYFGHRRPYQFRGRAGQVITVSLRPRRCFQMLVWSFFFWENHLLVKFFGCFFNRVSVFLLCFKTSWALCLLAHLIEKMPNDTEERLWCFTFLTLCYFSDKTSYFLSNVFLNI